MNNYHFIAIILFILIIIVIVIMVRNSSNSSNKSNEVNSKVKSKVESKNQEIKDVVATPKVFSSPQLESNTINPINTNKPKINKNQPSPPRNIKYGRPEGKMQISWDSPLLFNDSLNDSTNNQQEDQQDNEIEDGEIDYYTIYYSDKPIQKPEDAKVFGPIVGNVGYPCSVPPGIYYFRVTATREIIEGDEKIVLESRFSEEHNVVIPSFD